MQNYVNIANMQFLDSEKSTEKHITPKGCRLVVIHIFYLFI